MNRLITILLLLALVAPASLAGALGVSEPESGVVTCCCVRSSAAEAGSGAGARLEKPPCDCGCGMSESDHRGAVPARELAISPEKPAPERDAIGVLSGAGTANSTVYQRIIRIASCGESPPSPAIYLLVCSFIS